MTMSTMTIAVIVLTSGGAGRGCERRQQGDDDDG
jgi:hypothetical protein